MFNTGYLKSCCCFGRRLAPFLKDFIRWRKGKPAPKRIAKRIALWGGSFNPPTIAHKFLSDYAFSNLGLDLMYWIVSPHNPTKDPATLAPFDHRHAMVEQLLHGQPNRIASRIEQEQGSSWTIDTVRAMRRQLPDDYLFFMMGTDNWLQFHEWGDNYAEILDHVSIAVFNRPGLGQTSEQAEATRIFADRRVMSPQDLKKSGSFYLMKNPEFDMSATQVRNELARGQVPVAIAPVTLDYIREHGLYSRS